MKIKFKIKANLKCPWPSGTIYHNALLVVIRPSSLLAKVVHRVNMAAAA